MRAFASKINVYDDDDALLGELVHECDDIYKFYPSDTYLCSSDYRFIADVLESFLVEDFTENSIKKDK